MSRGGARNRSGPAPDLNSGRSDRRSLSFSALPNEGYAGEAPEWPLSQRRVMRWEHEGDRRYQVIDDDATESVAAREAELWEWAWRTPQAAAWAVETWRWQAVAMWVRTFVICEGDEAKAADKGAIHRFADQIGLTPAGLKENGWAIAQSQIPTADDSDTEQPEQKSTSGRARDRLRVASGGG